MIQKKKYQTWGNFLKTKRELKYRSAREFCSKMDLEISYAQYSRYEAGDQLPGLEQALMMCKHLEVSAVEALVEWSRAQIEDPAICEELSGLLDLAQGKSKKPQGAAFSDSSIALDDVIVFNRSHLKIFASDPAYRDIFTYVNSFAPEWVSTEEISAALELSAEKTASMVKELADLGVILCREGRCGASKKLFYFPDDQDFFQLRNQNLIHNSSAILKKLDHHAIQNKKAYRGVLTRELTEEQLSRVISQLDAMMNQVIKLPENPGAERIYSLCLLMGERFTRPDVAKATAEDVALGPPLQN